LLVGYWMHDSLRAIREEVRLWHEALKARVDFQSLSRAMSSCVYAAEVNPDNGDLYVAQYEPGDWCGLASEHNRPLPRDWTQLPAGWPEEYRSTISQLAQNRSGAREG
jgi:hypothetical protein